MSENSPYVFQLGKNDIGIAIIDLLNLKWNQGCPFAPSLTVYAPGSGKAGTDLQEIVQDEICRKALAILASPSYSMIFNTGGGMTTVSYMNIYSNPDIEGNAVVSITPSFNDSILIQYFDDPASFAVWFADTITFSGDDEAEMNLPARFSLESLIYVLHTIDCYRRVTYRNMLEYRNDNELMISSQEFAYSLNTSINSKDIRWLLPAFAMLTPNLARYGIQLMQDSMNIVVDAKLLLPVRKSDTGEEFYKFEEPARILGASFYGSWIMGIGFESMSYLADGGVSSINNGFLAPTAAGTHLFRIEKGSDGKGVVNYSNLSYDNFIDVLSQIISGTTAFANADIGTLKCSKCGNELSQGVKFCKHCGARQD